MEKYLIVGLGNPGLKYKNTRHNAGFMALDYLSQKWDVKLKKSKCRAILGETDVCGNKVILAKPMTYMNNSGLSVRELIQYFDIPLSRLLVIYDDMDLELGTIRIRKKGGPGTHNGMKSIIYHLESEEFPRIRIGIGESGQCEAIGHVLGRFKKEERESAFAGIEAAALAAEKIVEEGMDIAMNRYNGNNTI